MTTETKRQDNRERMPNVAEIVDQIKDFFGPVKVLAAEDYVTGVKVGEFPERERIPNP